MPYKSKQSALFNNWQDKTKPVPRLWYRKKRRTINSKLRQAIIDVLPFDMNIEKADQVLNIIFDTIKNELLKGKPVTLPLIGKMYVHTRPKYVRYWEGKYQTYPVKRYANFELCKALILDLEDKQPDGTTGTV